MNAKEIEALTFTEVGKAYLYYSATGGFVVSKAIVDAMNQLARKAKNYSSKAPRQLMFAAALAFAALCPQPFLIAAPSVRAIEKSEAAPVSTDTREDRLAVFDDVWSTINERYYDASFNSLSSGLSWDAQRTNFRALAAETSSARELYSVLRQMIASLDDPHTRVFSPSERFDWWRPRFVTIGLTIKEIGGLPIVVQVEPGSPPHRAGIVPGDIIESIDNQPAPLLAQRRISGYLAPGAQVRARVFANLVDGPPQSVVALSWRAKGGNRAAAHFRRYWHERELGLRVRKNGNLAIVEMDAFTGETSRAFVRALRELRDIRGIVLDLRSNGGGDAEAMTDVASSLLGAGFNLGRFIDRLGTPLSLVTRVKSPMIPDRLPYTNLPLVVLSSERTSSAAEIFIAGLRASGRAKVVGTETCGCVLAIRTRHQLPDGGLLDISELDYQTASGRRLEKNGIKPDETVIVERRDLYSGHDRALELAIRKLKTLQHVKQTVSLLR